MAKGLGNLMRQAQQMQKKLEEIQAEAAEKTVEASSGGGMVKCVVNGKQELLSISIDREVVDPEDVDMLQDLIMAAVSDALIKSKEMLAADMGKVAGGLGMNIPGLM